jgi:hypothetical protein
VIVVDDVNQSVGENNDEVEWRGKKRKMKKYENVHNILFMTMMTEGQQKQAGIIIYKLQPRLKLLLRKSLNSNNQIKRKITYLSSKPYFISSILCVDFRDLR